MLEGHHLVRWQCGAVTFQANNSKTCIRRRRCIMAGYTNVFAVECLKVGRVIVLILLFLLLDTSTAAGITDVS